MPSTARKARERSDNSTEAVTRLSEVTDKMHALLVARATNWSAAPRTARRSGNWRRSPTPSKHTNGSGGHLAEFQAAKDSCHNKRTSRVRSRTVPNPDQALQMPNADAGLRQAM
jgi:hypothetical protein